MTGTRPSFPAYIRMPDGLRFAGTVRFAGEGRFVFLPKQTLSTVPPEGLPVHLTVAGIGKDGEDQVTLASSIARAGVREVLLEPDAEPPEHLIAALAPDSVVWLPPREEADTLLREMQDKGQETLHSGMRRFLVELGDQLFDLSTSPRYGISGQHAHYDALNALKRRSDSFLATFDEKVRDSLETLEKDATGQTFADLEAASARTLDLVALDEMDQKLAVDKIINRQIDRHRLALECLTIRAALLADLEPREARTPFHPTHIVQAFVQAFEAISDDTTVVIDALNIFRDKYLPLLEGLYATLNTLLAEAGIEADLEDHIRENGSILNPVEKRILKSETRSGPESAETDDEAPARGNSRERGEGAQERSAGSSAAQQAGNSSGPLSAQASRDKHDALYDAVVSALDTHRGQGTSATGDEVPASTPPGAARPDTTAAAPSIDTNRLATLLEGMQREQAGAAVASLADLPSLEDLVRDAVGGEEAATLDRDGANRLGFVDNVFRTLQTNFDVSADMAPSLARLRIPLARLSLQEPRFFAEPDHPAHQFLDKLSVLASADQTVNRALQGKVAALVDRIANTYQGDNKVFAEAQGELDTLLSQQGRMLEKNVERVVRNLEGQERLTRAQRSVEALFMEHMDPEHVPRPLLALLESGWRAALVQTALREGTDSTAWREEADLLGQLSEDLAVQQGGTLSGARRTEMEHRLHALQKRLNVSNPGSVAHEEALTDIHRALRGELPFSTSAYHSALAPGGLPDASRVEQLPRLRRWLKRVRALTPGTRLRYVDKEGRRRRMKLVWVSEDQDRFAFVNERGQKVAELTAVQLARQLSRGAQPPTPVDEMSVLRQSMYETLEQAQKTLSFERNRDAVTRLINTDALLKQLRRTLRHAHAHDSEHAFLCLDIDNFKLVNEVFDETSGDEVLAEFARLLGQLNDRRALTARLEEDEFGILLAYRPADEARRLADKIRADIAASSLSIGDEAVSFTVSLGLAPIQRTSESPETIVEQARSALEIAKSQGKDQVVVYDLDQEEIHRYRQERDSSRQRLDEAMDTDRLVLTAQPLVKSAMDGSEEATHRYEVLLALRDDAGELQSPRDFIRSAERFGFITQVDRWVVRETFAWMSSLVDQQKQVPELAINLSGTSITDNAFLDYVLEQISEYGVGTNHICFEITETGAIDNLPKAADFVRTLKNIGCQFSLDDFGTGLASHRYLKELPVDYVKIDGTFISDLHTNRTDYAMTKSINDLAHFLGQKTVAECVETMDIVPALREIGVDYLQGWGVGMPRILSEIRDELPDLET